jgi:type I restriction enzyme S subunit
MQMLGTTYRGRLSHEPRSWGEIKKAYTHFRDGDVLLAKVTPCFENGKAGIASGLPNGIGAGSSEFYVLRPNPGVDCRYLLAYLSTLDFRRRATMAMTGAVGLRRVPRDFLISDELPIAPSAEQQRIADKLDTILTRVDAVSARLDRVAPLLKRFRQSVLAAATSGRLTEDWRQTAQVTAWRSCTIGDITQSSYYGPRFGATEYTADGSGVPTIRTTDMTRKGLIAITDATPRVIVPDEKLATYQVLPGDLLVTRTGSIGVMAVFEEDYTAVPSAYLIRFRFTSAVLPRFAYLLLAAPSGQEAMGLSSTAITQPNINAEAIKRIEVSLPTLEEQTEIIRRVEVLFAVADRLEARLKAAKAATGRLTPALLAKAFRGELVPQDPDDEPASELLRRLQAASDHRAPARAAGRGRKRSI